MACLTDVENFKLNSAWVHLDSNNKITITNSECSFYGDFAEDIFRNLTENSNWGEEKNNSILWEHLQKDPGWNQYMCCNNCKRSYVKRQYVQVGDYELSAFCNKIKKFVPCIQLNNKCHSSIS